MRNTRFLGGFAIAATLIWVFVTLGFAIDAVAIIRVRLSILSFINESLYFRGASHEAVAVVNTVFGVLAGILGLSVFVINGFWLYFTARNAALGSPTVTVLRPGWLVIWMWVPLGNLIVPYRSMRAIYQQYQPTRRTAFNVFWGFWCAYVTPKLLFTLMSLDQHIWLHDALGPNWQIVITVAHFIAAACGVMFCHYIYAVTRAQNGAIAERFD